MKTLKQHITESFHVSEAANFIATTTLKPGDNLSKFKDALQTDDGSIGSRGLNSKVLKQVEKEMDNKNSNIEKIEISDSGYFYIYTVDDGIFDPANMEVHSEWIVGEPRTQERLAQDIVKKWAFDLRDGTAISWVSNSNWNYHEKSRSEQTGINKFDLLVNGKVIGNGKDANAILSVIKSNIRLFKDLK